MQKGKQKVSDIDKFIGSKIKEARVSKGMGIIQLAAAVGDITHQQLHKYEVGANRTPNSRLLKIAKITGVGMLFFFPSGSEDIPEDPESDRLALDLLKDFSSIKDYNTKQNINALVRSVLAVINNCNKT